MSGRRYQDMEFFWCVPVMEFLVTVSHFIHHREEEDRINKKK